MVTVSRSRLEPARAATEKTWVIRLMHEGVWLDLENGNNDLGIGALTITAVATSTATSETDLTVTCTNYTQTGANVGKCKLTITSGVLTAARVGDWYLDVKATESGGNAQPVYPRLLFTLEPKQTEA